MVCLGGQTVSRRVSGMKTTGIPGFGHKDKSYSRYNLYGIKAKQSQGKEETKTPD